MAGAFLLTRLLASLLYGVDAVDPATFAAVPPLLMAVALAACLQPTWRAISVDPAVSLRAE